jgi:hypothetical protein
MTNVRCGSALLGLAFLFVWVLPSAGQTLFEMKVHLGPRNQLEIDAEYRDPADIDRRLSGTRVIPIRLTVRNRSGQPEPLDYRDVTLDLGGNDGVTRLMPVDPGAARKTLLTDAKYDEFIKFVGRQTDRFTNIDPFSRAFPNGPLAPGQMKDGYVFFMRPEHVSFTSFLALGTVSYLPKILSTNDFTVMSPEKEATSLWHDTYKTFEAWTRGRADSLRRAVREILDGPPPFKTSYALLMGVSDYRYMERLPRVKNDLDRMSTVLRGLGFTVVRVDNEKLTMANVRSPQDFFLKFSLTSEDRLLVFFAGHGFPRSERGRMRGYLALINARNGETENTIAMDDFVAWTQRVPAKHLLVLLESCFSGLAVGGRDVQLMGDSPGTARAAMPDPLTLYQLSREPGRYLLMAGDENQRVPMGERWNGGLFADAVVQGLQGKADVDKDGFVTARELYPWVRTYVSAEAFRVLGANVTPLIKDLHPVVSKGEFVFTKAK